MSEGPKDGGARRAVSVLVTDIGGFSEFSDVTEPEYVFDTLREYHALMGEVMERFGGEIFDVAGDAILVVFEDARRPTAATGRAIQAALEAHLRGQALVAQWKRRGQDVSLKMAITAGHATLGTVSVGAYSKRVAVGSMLNAAFHMTGTTRESVVLASHAVADVAGGLAEVIPRRDLSVRGHARKVDVFELRAVAEPA